MASNTKVISSTTLSHHYRLIHVWNLSLNDRFIKYYWNEHFTLCLICNSSACSSVHTKYHISFHATWASCLWTCLNKLYRGERSYKLLFFGAANTHFSPASSCFLIFFIISLCLALPCFIAPRSIPRFCLELLLMRAAAASLKCFLCMHIYEILVFVLSPHAFISQWRESSTSLGSVCGLYDYFVTHTIKTHFCLNLIFNITATIKCPLLLLLPLIFTKCSHDRRLTYLYLMLFVQQQTTFYMQFRETFLLSSPLCCCFQLLLLRFIK